MRPSPSLLSKASRFQLSSKHANKDYYKGPSLPSLRLPPSADPPPLLSTTAGRRQSHPDGIGFRTGPPGAHHPSKSWFRVDDHRARFFVGPAFKPGSSEFAFDAVSPSRLCRLAGMRWLVGGSRGCRLGGRGTGLGGPVLRWEGGRTAGQGESTANGEAGHARRLAARGGRQTPVGPSSLARTRAHDGWPGGCPCGHWLALPDPSGRRDLARARASTFPLLSLHPLTLPPPSPCLRPQIKPYASTSTPPTAGYPWGLPGARARRAEWYGQMAAEIPVWDALREEQERAAAERVGQRREAEGGQVVESTSG